MTSEEQDKMDNKIRKIKTVSRAMIICIIGNGNQNLRMVENCLNMKLYKQKSVLHPTLLKKFER